MVDGHLVSGTDSKQPQETHRELWKTNIRTNIRSTQEKHRKLWKNSSRKKHKKHTGKSQETLEKKQNIRKNIRRT